MKRLLICLLAGTGLSACQTAKVFQPKSDYPAPPWVQGYADPEDCLGGERLAAIDIPAPDYPRRAFNNGVQGWVLVRLDVTPSGEVINVQTERASPQGQFERSAEEGVDRWLFQPPGEAGLTNCRVLISYRLGNVSIGG